MLTQSRLKHFAHYDPETGVFTRIRSMHGNAEYRRVVEKKNSSGYFRFCIDYKVYHVHVLAWLYMTGKYPDHEVDHINRIKSDNRWINLRKAEAAENVRNRGLNKNNISGHKGVFWNKQRQKWQGVVLKNYKQHHVGFFDDIEAANAAVRAKREELHGTFCNHG